MTPRTLPRLRVRWVRYRTADTLIRAYRQGIAKRNGWLLRETYAPPGLLRIVRSGMWAFTDVQGEPPVVRYWHAESIKPELVAAMLGHELGHAVGRKERGHAAEEARADEYGRVAAEVFRRVSGKRGAR